MLPQAGFQRRVEDSLTVNVEDTTPPSASFAFNDPDDAGDVLTVTVTYADASGITGVDATDLTLLNGGVETVADVSLISFVNGVAQYTISAPGGGLNVL